MKVAVHAFLITVGLFLAAALIAVVIIAVGEIGLVALVGSVLFAGIYLVVYSTVLSKGE